MKQRGIFRRIATMAYMLLIPCLLFTACGSVSSESLSNSYDSIYDGAYDSNAESKYEDMNFGMSDVDVEYSGSTMGQDDDSAGMHKNNSSSIKLVYESKVTIDTLDFVTSCALFDDLVDKYNGFIESKSIQDDAGYVSYVYGDSRDDKRHTLIATVRIPADNYTAFMSETSDIGDIRSSKEDVTNMTQTYGTLTAQLEILETEYDSYMRMLDEATEDGIRLQIKENLTEIAVNIATIKSNLSSIDMDVDYSTIRITIQEVEEYEEDVDDSTFLSRLKNTVKTSWEELLDFLENILFTIILEWYVWLFYIIVIMIIVKVVKRIKNRKTEKSGKSAFSRRKVEQTGSIEPVAEEPDKSTTE